MPVEQISYNPPTVAYQYREYEPKKLQYGRYPTDKNGYLTKPEDIIKCRDLLIYDLNKKLDTIKEIHERNLIPIEHNLEYKRIVRKFMEASGIPATYKVWELPTPRHKNKKEITKWAGWYEDLQRVCKTSDGYESVVNLINNQIKKHNEYVAKRLKELEQAAKDDYELRIQNRMTPEAQMILAEIKTRNNVPTEYEAKRTLQFQITHYTALITLKKAICEGTSHDDYSSILPDEIANQLADAVVEQNRERMVKCMNVAFLTVQYV